MDSRIRRARAAQLRELATSHAFALIVTWLVNAVHELAQRGDALSDATDPWRPIVHVQDALLGVLSFHLDADALTAARLDYLVRVEARRPCDAALALADELEHEARLQDEVPEVNVTVAERLDETGRTVDRGRAFRLPEGSILLPCDAGGEVGNGAAAMVIPAGGLGIGGVLGTSTSRRYLVVRHGHGALVAAGQ